MIAPRPLTEFVPLLFKGNTADITTQFDMKGVERIGLLKMDFLGLRTLTLIDNCVKMIAAQTGERIDPDHCPLDDAQTYELFTRGPAPAACSSSSRTACATSCERFKPDRLEHLTALNALYRPGPMQMIDDFIKRRHGQTKVTYEHPLLEPILAETYGVMVYQEQVMQIASALAGFTLGEADILRKAMGKKKADVMATQKDKFLKGCAGRGVPEKKAAEDLGPHGAVRRLRLQQVALRGLRLARLPDGLPQGELSRPTSWPRCSPRSARTPTRWSQYIGECREMGIRVLPPDVNQSDMFFTVVAGGEAPYPIRFGLAAHQERGRGRGGGRSCARGATAAPSARSSTSASAWTCAP